MQNYHAMVIEAKHRRREWERAIAADARSALARPENERMHWPRLVQGVRASLRALSWRRRPLPSWRSAAPHPKQRSRPEWHASTR
jgi:hypothetical protein